MSGTSGSLGADGTTGVRPASATRAARSTSAAPSARLARTASKAQAALRARLDGRWSRQQPRRRAIVPVPRCRCQRHDVDHQPVSCHNDAHHVWRRRHRLLSWHHADQSMKTKLIDREMTSSMITTAHRLSFFHFFSLAVAEFHVKRTFQRNER